MRLKYTGERVIPNQMSVDPINLSLHLQRYIFAIPYSVNKDCLDVACGTGYGMSLISMLAKSVIGIDKDRETINWAKKNNIYYSKKIKFLKLDLNKSQIPNKYDTVVSYETIEHLDSPLEFLEKVKFTLNLNSQFILSTPINEKHNPFHKHFFDWISLAKLVESVFGKNIEWFSQNINSIQEGKKENALFAICVISGVNSTISYRINKVKKILKREKKKITGLLQTSSINRW